MAKRRYDPPSVEPRLFQSADEIDNGIAKLKRRTVELEQLDLASAVQHQTGADKVAASNVRETIREVFGTNSPEFREHEHLRLSAGPQYMRMQSGAVLKAKKQGRTQATAVLIGLISRLEEKREDLVGGDVRVPATYFERLNLHPRIVEVTRDLFLDGHHWEAVFAAAKVLLNFTKERSGRHDLDGASLVRAVFSRKDPILAFNDLKDPTDLDEQEGMMHLFEGVVLGIRNPGGHIFPEGTEQRAIEYISLLSLLAYRVQESRRRKSAPPRTDGAAPTSQYHIVNRSK